MFAERLKHLRKKQKLTQRTLAQAMEVSQQAVAQWEAGRATPEYATLARLAAYFDTSLEYLLGMDATLSPLPYSGGVQVGIIGVVRAGYGLDATEEPLGYELADVRDPKRYFYLLVRGDSMEPYILDGDLALVRRQPMLEDGDLGIVVYGGGEGTLKRFRQKGKTVTLEPLNPTCEPLRITGEDLEQLHIVGKVIETKRRWA